MTRESARTLASHHRRPLALANRVTGQATVNMIVGHGLMPVMRCWYAAISLAAVAPGSHQPATCGRGQPRLAEMDLSCVKDLGQFLGC